MRLPEYTGLLILVLAYMGVIESGYFVKIPAGNEQLIRDGIDSLGTLMGLIVGYRLGHQNSPP
jgi:hypothetical protein